MRTSSFYENNSPQFKHYIKRSQSCTYVIWSVQISSHSEFLCVENLYFVLSDPQIALIVITWCFAILVRGQCANLLQVKDVARGDVQ